MNGTLEQVAKQAISLAPCQRLVLAGFLLEADASPLMLGVDQAWETEIEARVQAVETGTIEGIPFSEVMRPANARQAP